MGSQFTTLIRHTKNHMKLYFLDMQTGTTPRSAAPYCQVTKLSSVFPVVFIQENPHLMVVYFKVTNTNECINLLQQKEILFQVLKN